MHNLDSHSTNFSAAPTSKLGLLMLLTRPVYHSNAPALSQPHVLKAILDISLAIISSLPNIFNPFTYVQEHSANSKNSVHSRVMLSDLKGLPSAACWVFNSSSDALLHSTLTESSNHRIL